MTEELKLQQNSVEWLIARMGRFTASDVYLLFKPGRGKEYFSKRGKDLILKKAAEKYYKEHSPSLHLYIERTQINARAMNWGHMYEDSAALMFERKFKIPLRRAGFYTFYYDVGASPDRVFLDGSSLVEIKCPYSPAQYIRAKMIHDAEDLIEEKPEYYWQCQFQMFVTGIKECVLAFYDPGLKEIHTINLEYEHNNIAEVINLAISEKNRLYKILNKSHDEKANKATAIYVKEGS